MDIDILLGLQQFRNAAGPGLAEFFTKMTFFGELSVTPVLLAIVYWCISKEYGAYLLVGWSGNRLLNGGLKITACAYRPWIRDPRVVPYGNAISTATGYSFPSGHSMNAATVFGGAAVRKDMPRLLRVLSVLFVALVAFSRIYLGVHTPQDILVGSLSGLLMMWIVLHVMRWVENHPDKDWLVAVIGVGLAVIIAVFAALKPYPRDFDAEGKLLVDGAKMANDTYKCVGWSAGILIGWILERRFVRFSTEISMVSRITRLIAGLLSYYAFNLILLTWVKGLLPGISGTIVTCFLQMFYIVFLFPCFLKRPARKA